MNQYDTEVAEGLLEKAGFKVISGSELVMPDYAGPENCRDQQGIEQADVILMNTCSVRRHAEERVWGRLGMLGKAKKNNPDLVIGLMGCMVEEHGSALFKRFPQLDIMIGTRNIPELPELLREVIRTRRQSARIKQEGLSIEYTDQIKRHDAWHAWLPIMTGCDKVCTFCIVPKTRGREVSMPFTEVLREAGRLGSEGVKWITLLGQNVNSYDGGMKFPELLDRLCEVPGIARISFTTSHPSDATPELFSVIQRNPKISRRFHLPLQSGSDRILKRMKRLHTYEDFRKKLTDLRERVPDIVMTTDIIAGFSGETEADYEATKRALEELRFDGAYIYKYSVREGTPAAKMPDDVPLELKETRNRELLKIQKRITDENHRQWIGQTVEVFTEGQNRKNSKEWIGRSLQEKRVVFQGPKDCRGTFQKIKILELKHETFVGQIAEQESVAGCDHAG